MFWTFQAFPSLRDPIQGLPEWIAKRMSPAVADFLRCQIVGCSFVTGCCTSSPVANIHAENESTSSRRPGSHRPGNQA